MTVSKEPADSISFVIAPPFMRQVIGLAGAVPFLLLACWFPLKVGLDRTVHAFTDSSLGWLLYAMLLAPVAFLLRLAFPPRSAMARLQIRHDGISFIPG